MQRFVMHVAVFCCIPDSEDAGDDEVSMVIDHGFTINKFINGMCSPSGTEDE